MKNVFLSLQALYMVLCLILLSFFSQNKILSMYSCPEMYFYKFICVNKGGGGFHSI